MGMPTTDRIGAATASLAAATPPPYSSQTTIPTALKLLTLRMYPMAWASLYAKIPERKYLRFPTTYSALHLRLDVLIPHAIGAK